MIPAAGQVRDVWSGLTEAQPPRRYALQTGLVSEPSPAVGRRVVLGAGLAAVGLGAAACSPSGDDDAVSSSSASRRPSTTSPAGTYPSHDGSGTPPASAGPGGADAVPLVLRTPGADVRRSTSATAAVALTFHGAGDPSLTRGALALLAQEHAHVTVFAVGTWLTDHPDLGQAIVAAGHDLGNHTWSHQTLPRLSPVAARAEIARGARAVASIHGSRPYLFRPSGTPSSTATIRAAARASGYARCVSFDVDPADYQDPGRGAVVSRTLAAVRAGSIVSLHLGHAGTIDALPAILDGLAARSLAPLTVTRLLA
jgi:peptidoglycan/xylan/chitin deacetylase (PgdA/CDA1 family)